MVIERDVTIKLNVQKGREGQAFADASKGARTLQKEVGAAGQAVNAMISGMKKSHEAETQISRISRQLTKMGVEANRARTAATNLVKQVGDRARVSTREVERLGQAMRKMPGSRGAAAASGLGNGINAMLGPLLGAAVAQSAGRGLAAATRTDVDQEYFAGRQRNSAGLRIVEEFTESLPVLGEAARAIKGLMTFSDRTAFQARRQREGREAERTDLERQNTGIYRRARVSVGGIVGDESDSLSRLQSGRHISRTESAVALEQFRRSQRMDGIRRSAADEMRTFDRGGALGRGSLDSLHQESLRTIRGRDDPLAADQQRIESERRLAQRGLGRGSDDRASAMRDVDSAAEADALNRQVQLRQRLMQLERDQSNLARQRSQIRRQELSTLRDQAAQQEEMYRSIAERERERTQSLRERFGSMDEMQRRQLLQISGQIRQGGNLSQEQREIILQHRDFFGDQARGILNNRADAGGFNRFSADMGSNRRAEAADARAREARDLRVAMETRIAAEITVNAEQTATELARNLAPHLRELSRTMMDQLGVRITEEMDRAAANRNAVAR